MRTLWYALHRKPISPWSAFEFKSREVNDPNKHYMILVRFYEGTDIAVEIFESENDFLHAKQARAFAGSAPSEHI